MKAFDYSVVKHYKFYGFVKNVFAPLFKVLYKLKFKGLENVPTDKNERYIVAINHTSALDPVFVAIPKNVPPLHFMAKIELFQNPIVGWVIEHLYGFPVRRGKGDTSAIEYGEKIIEEGHVMAICPEGTRVKDKDGVPQKAKSGVALIAKATKASVLPVAICCNGPIKAGKQVTVSYGKMLTLADMGLDKEDASISDIKNAANLVMDNILALWEAERNAD
ncbi:MAG: 1-acyl-sn-glycerol-3-phosphate acyltransferase [Eubacterium sp.]|nr:1-acyl-sn-glycerol-3-phosphate acyltransferase [Eubacterium sp.]